MLSRNTRLINFIGMCTVDSEFNSKFCTALAVGLEITRNSLEQKYYLEDKNIQNIHSSRGRN